MNSLRFISVNYKVNRRGCFWPVFEPFWAHLEAKMPFFAPSQAELALPGTPDSLFIRLPAITRQTDRRLLTADC
jgi:hypothetical protein